MIIGTAGHVDHGKTTLVRALTGVDGDRLPEERRRGMTIDLGYAYAGAWGFIDVPGHERLVATMLAGAGGIDAALLAVAADDGVMPQTVEHVQVLDLLGVAQGVVAITRADRAPDRVAAVAAQVRALLAGTGLVGATVLPVSAVTGEGIEPLRAALAALSPAGRDAAGHARLAVDRAFTVAGAGLVVTGTLVCGRIAVGERLLLSPGGQEARVRGLHAQNRPAEAAMAGQRVALNLAGLARADVARGDWVLHPEAHAPTALLDGTLRTLPGAPGLRGGLPVHVHLAAAHVTGRLDPLGAGLARLVLDRTIGALAGDRFVLRDAAARRTIGGGVVLDPFPPRRGARAAARLALLARGPEPPEAALAARLADGPVAFAPFARARNLPVAAQGAVVDRCRRGAGGRLRARAGRARHAAARAGRDAGGASRGAAGRAGPAGVAPARAHAAAAVRRPAGGGAAARGGAAGRAVAAPARAPDRALAGGRAAVAGGGGAHRRRAVPPAAHPRPRRFPRPARAGAAAALKRFARLGRVVEVAHAPFLPAARRWPRSLASRPRSNGDRALSSQGRCATIWTTGGSRRFTYWSSWTRRGSRGGRAMCGGCAATGATCSAAPGLTGFGANANTRARVLWIGGREACLR